MEMFWKLLCACLVAVIIWKLGEWLFRVNVGKHGEWSAGVNVRKLGDWLVQGIVSTLAGRWLFEPIVCKIESIVRKVAERLVKGIHLVEKIVCKVAKWLVKEIGYALSYYEIGYVDNCRDNMPKLKVLVEWVTVRLRDLEEAARHNEQGVIVRAWQESARSAVEWANDVLEDAERADKKRKALYQLSRKAEVLMEVFAKLRRCAETNFNCYEIGYVFSFYEIYYVLRCYEIGYVHNCKDNMLRLKAVVDLVTVRLRYLEEATGDERRIVFVRKWQEHVRSVVERANKVLEDAERAYKKRFLGFCPDLKALYQLSQKAEKLITVFVELQQFSDSILHGFC